MNRCEQCGVAFAIAGGLHAVTTCRILCPRCSAAHARHRRSPEPASKHVPHRGAHRIPHGHDLVLGSVGETHRRLVRERKHRQTMLGLATVAGMLLLGVALAMLRLA